jgi:hypothetical protein
MFFIFTSLITMPGVSTRLGTTFIAAILASMVECVEALTVVLAVGSVRG